MVHSEEVGAINLNKRQADGGHYADTHARYDYITVNHFADISSADQAAGKTTGVTISNPDLSFARMGRSTPATLDTATPQLNLLAGGQVDGPPLGIRRQNGATQFLQRFALRAHGGYSAVQAMRFALEHQNPLLAAPVIGRTTGDYPAAQFSLLNIDNPNVLLWAVKPADDGIRKGLALRLWNLDDAPGRAAISLSNGVLQAERATHIETALGQLPLDAQGRVPVQLAQQQLMTVIVQPRALP